MSTVSENGVLCASETWKGDGDTVTLEVPVHLLTTLQQAWQAHPDPAVGLDSDSLVVEAVRDLFDGQDGMLTFLAAVGIPTEPR